MAVLLEQATGNKFEVFRNDTKAYEFTSRDATGEANNLSSYDTVKFAAKEHYNDPTVIFEATGAFVTDGSDGKMNIPLTAANLANAGTFIAEIRVEDSVSGDEWTLGQFTFVIHPDLN